MNNIYDCVGGSLDKKFGMPKFSKCESGYSKSRSLSIVSQTASLWIHQRLRLSPNGRRPTTDGGIGCPCFDIDAFHQVPGGFNIQGCQSKKGLGLCFDGNMGDPGDNYLSKNSKGRRELWAIVNRMLKTSKTSEFSPLEIPMWKWDEISMDFVTGLPTTQKRHDAIWVVVDRLTKKSLDCHVQPTSIVPTEIRSLRLVFCKGLQKAWELVLSSVQNNSISSSKTDGQQETIQTLEDMLRAFCALEWPGSWDGIFVLGGVCLQ
ncbi:retrotransposable element Tf2 [Tanacetum coccineum]